MPNETNIAFTVHSGIEYNGERNGFFGGLSLYASDTEGVVHEYIYDESDRSWSDEQKLSKVDGFSGASAFWTSNSEYIFSLSETGSLQFHWRKYEKDDDNGDEDEDDEVDDWNIGPTSPAPVTENADICATHGFAFQAPDGTIRGSNFTYLSNASRARWDADYDISEGPRPMGQASPVSTFSHHLTRTRSKRCSMCFIKSKTEKSSRPYGTGRRTTRRFLETGATELYPSTNWEVDISIIITRLTNLRAKQLRFMV